MQTEITGHNVEISETLREHFEKQTRRINQRVLPPPESLHAVLRVEKTSSYCDINMLWDGKPYSAQGVDDDMYVAIDRAIDKISRQIGNNKGRKLARRRDSHDHDDC